MSQALDDGGQLVREVIPDVAEAALSLAGIEQHRKACRMCRSVIFVGEAMVAEANANAQRLLGHVALHLKRQRIQVSQVIGLAVGGYRRKIRHGSPF